ncbi:hypothetical protein D3C81_342860 [compost metagenome]
MGQVAVGTLRLEAHPVVASVYIMPIGLHHGLHLVAGTTELLAPRRLDHLGPDQADPHGDQAHHTGQEQAEFHSIHCEGS